MIENVVFRTAGGAQPLILVPASVNGGTPSEFILDTGAGVTLLSHGLAARAGVRATDTKEGAGAGGRITVQLGKADKLTVGRMTLRDVAVAMTDDVLRIGSAVNATVGGTLGYSFFQKLHLTVDYRASLLTMDPSRREPSSAAIPMRLAHPGKPLILVTAAIDGSGEFTFAVDTGASTTVLSAELARRLGLQTRPAPQMTGGGGVLGASSGILQSLSIGDATCRAVTVMIAEFVTTLSSLIGVGLDGIVGYNVLRNFRVGIDYPNLRLSLDPHTQFVL